MIVVVRLEHSDPQSVNALCRAHGGRPTVFDGKTLVVTPASVRDLDPAFAAMAESVHVFQGDVQLGNLAFHPRRTVSVGDLTIDGTGTYIVAGPCSVESEAQIRSIAEFLVRTEVRLLRAGAYKPRTSPYSFQGMGREGLALLRRVGDEFGLRIVTEARDATHIDDVLEFADIIQIGAKAMYDHGILNACGASRKPVLLKRSFGATTQEFLQSAEFILAGGNPNVILCERGIRTFESNTRFTLDLCGVAYMKKHSNLPIFIDPSHAMGERYGVPDLSRASVAMGVEGLLIEVHPNPAEALSDAAQQLDFEEFSNLRRSLIPVASAVGRALR